MDSELKKQFALRITQASRTELVVITYEMFLVYIDDAKKDFTNGDQKAFRLNIQRARGCLKELMDSLNYDYEFAGNLLSLYVYISKQLVMADLHNDPLPLEETIKIISKLRDAYAAISNEDKEGPVMENAQTVNSGLTYSKTGLNVSVSGTDNRGFLV
ncbi:MAG: flagellar protein FliS [Lachnospiraceae bacterium]|nr:flagellar protein FliS [Lachnospiraceae bacterium]